MVNKAIFIIFYFFLSSSVMASSYWIGNREIKTLYVQDDNTVLVEIDNTDGMSVCTYSEGKINAHLRLVSGTVARQNLFSVLLAAKASNTQIAVNYTAPINTGDCSRDELPKLTQVSIQ